MNNLKKALLGSVGFPPTQSLEKILNFMKTAKQISYLVLSVVVKVVKVQKDFHKTLNNDKIQAFTVLVNETELEILTRNIYVDTIKVGDILHLSLVHLNQFCDRYIGHISKNGLITRLWQDNSIQR